MPLFNAENLSKDEQIIKKHCILLVDDEPENLSVITAILAEHYQLITASNGEEALAIITNENTPPISLIISDQRMPKMTGVEFFEKSVKIIPKTVRIVVTGFMDVNAIIDSINKAQIYRFILKPFERQDFLLTVQRALESFEMQQKIDNYQEELELEVTQRTQELQNTHAELKIALTKMEAQTVELEELNHDKDKFISILSHDIRGPLGSLGMMTELLEDKADQLKFNNGCKIAHQINSLTHKIQRLAENILQWTRVHGGHINCTPQSINPYQLAEDTIEMGLPLINKHQINCSNDIDPGKNIYADPDMTWAILRNFLSNAIKFTPKGGKITLSLDETEESTTIAVTNSGSYISSEVIERLFRIDEKYNMPGVRGEKGTGLGLLLCKEYMDKHHGDIGVTSDEDTGTRFYCTFTKTE